MTCGVRLEANGTALSDPRLPVTVYYACPGRWQGAA